MRQCRYNNDRPLFKMSSTFWKFISLFLYLNLELKFPPGLTDNKKKTIRKLLLPEWTLFIIAQSCNITLFRSVWHSWEFLLWLLTHGLLRIIPSHLNIFETIYCYNSFRMQIKIIRYKLRDMQQFNGRSNKFF